MELGLEGRVAAIAGASAGIGKAIAVELAREGVHVALLARTESTLADAERDVRDAARGDVVAIVTDATDPQSVDAAAQATADRFGEVNILVNTVGHRMRRFDRQLLWEDEDWVSDIDAKLVAMLRCIRGFLPHLATDGSGRVISVGGMSGEAVWESALTHGINNAAMTQASKYLARDLADAQITVNVVVPGLVGSEWRRQWAETMAANAGTTADEWLADYCGNKGVLARRWAEPEEVAHSVVFLASDGAKYVNGTTLLVDGGMSVNPR